MGVATFLLDGFTGRGIESTTADQFQFGTLTMINDAYRALELLAKHPRIDLTRIGIFGGSRGGKVALYASLAISAHVCDAGNSVRRLPAVLCPVFYHVCRRYRRC
jgi:dipeptidyl aminopeptidase/acylaminoacyl peptidase